MRVPCFDFPCRVCNNIIFLLLFFLLSQIFLSQRRCFPELNFISDRLVPPCGNQLPLEIVPPPAAPSLPHEELQKQLQQLKQVISQLEDRLRLQGVTIV